MSDYYTRPAPSIKPKTARELVFVPTVDSFRNMGKFRKELARRIKGDKYAHEHRLTRNKVNGFHGDGKYWD